jgi:type IX secretion system PorP/SprF family membrane protein
MSVTTMKNILLITSLTLVMTGGIIYDSTAQDAQFTQFYANPLYLNPAFAGSERCPRICVNFRDEWPAIPGNFVTYSASFDRYVDALSGGIGLLVEQDKAGSGEVSTTNISAIYAYQLNISRSFAINAGFQATYHQKSIDESKLSFDDEIDPIRGFVYQTGETLLRNSVTTPDFSAGILAYGKSVFFGAAFDHLTQPDESFVQGASPLPLKYTAHAGAMIPINTHSTLIEDQFTISPNVLFQKQGDFQQLDLGFYAIKGAVVGGFWYRNQDAVILLIGIDKRNIKFGYSYDVTISKLTLATGGSHELSLIFQFQCRPKRHTYRVVNCPSF